MGGLTIFIGIGITITGGITIIGTSMVAMADADRGAMSAPSVGDGVDTAFTGACGGMAANLGGGGSLLP